MERKFKIDPTARNAIAVGIPKEQKKSKKNIETSEPLVLSARYRVVDSYDGIEIGTIEEGRNPLYSVSLPDMDVSDWEKLREIKETILKDPAFDLSYIPDIEDRKKVFAGGFQKMVGGGDPDS